MIKPANHFLVLILCCLFAILYGLWLLPHTLFIRNTCLILGAFLSLPIIYSYRLFLLQKSAIPIGLIMLLLVWVTIHLFFIGENYDLQFLEYTKSWKKIAIGVVFALGLGLGILSQLSNKKEAAIYWRIIYLGFTLPTLIYFLKFAVTHYAPTYGFTIPKYLFLTPDHMGNPLGISKAWYVFFCLPALAIALGAITNALKDSRPSLKGFWIFIGIIPLVLLNFYLEQDRNGMIYSLVLIAVSLTLICLSWLKQLSFRSIFIVVLLLSVSVPFIVTSFKHNQHWQSIAADAKVAVQVNKYDHWRRSASVPYPLNELGNPTSPSNYDRVAWLVVGVPLTFQNPWGYGLMGLSFSGLIRQQYPDADASHTHNAWLDFTLGYGFPGLFLLAGAAFLAWKNSKNLPKDWALIGRWGIGSICLLLFTCEISSEVFIGAFIFNIIWISALSLKSSAPDIVLEMSSQ